MGKVSETFNGITGGIVTNVKEAHADIAASYQSILTQDAGWNVPAANYDPWLSQQISEQMPAIEADSMVGLSPDTQAPEAEQDSLVVPPEALAAKPDKDIGPTEANPQAQPETTVSDP